MTRTKKTRTGSNTALGLRRLARIALSVPLMSVGISSGCNSGEEAFGSTLFEQMSNLGNGASTLNFLESFWRFL